MGRGARASALLCLAGAAAVLLVAPPPAAVDRAAAVAVAELAAPGRAGLPAEPDQPAPPEGQCTDGTATWLGTRWREPVHWRLRTADVPDYLGSPDATRDVVRRAAGNVDVGRNTCGLAENLGTAQRFDGDTDRRAAVTPEGGCGQRDGHNVVSFGTLPDGVLAITCLWWVPGRDGSDGRTVEADILVNDSPGRFALTPPGDCLDRWDLESALTHEFGHVFGLGHVPAARHPGLTMGDALPPCDISHRSLGLGELQMLRARYGSG